MSYPNEKIFEKPAHELVNYKADPLSVICAYNPQAEPLPATHGMPDEVFLRGKAPMTKSEVRSVSLTKLKLDENSVCYDIGAGTGSVSVEMALRASQGQVYAIEKKEDALNLLKANKEKFALDHMQIIAGSAPKAMEELPAPTHAFIGGSSGNLDKIIDLLLAKNPQVRIVINCITLETVSETISCIRRLEESGADKEWESEVVQLAVSRAKKKLMLVVTGNEQSKERNITDLIDYIQYNNFEVTESKIYSIFDYLYKQYTEERRVYLQKHKKVSEYDSENLMYSLIEDIISANKYSSLDVVCHFPLNMLIKNPELLNEQECQYAMNPATHLDFLIYNRIGKKPVLAIEVDGYEYHKEDTVQASRDLLKNHIMELYEIPLLRFMTNGSGEKEKIIEMLDKLVG